MVNAARHNHPLLPLLGIGICYHWRMPSSELLKLFFHISEEDKVAVGTHHRFEEETCFLEYDVNIFCSNVFFVDSGWHTNYWLRTAKDLGKKE